MFFISPIDTRNHTSAIVNIIDDLIWVGLIGEKSGEKMDFGEEKIVEEDHFLRFCENGEWREVVLVLGMLSGLELRMV